MSRRIAEGSLSLCVVLLMFGTSSLAQDEAAFEESAFPADVTPSQTLPGDSLMHDGQAPAPACPAEASEGGGFFGMRARFPHFELPTRSYSLYRSQTSYGWEYRERCAPTQFTPRGDGIPIRTSCYRMDYKPYELKHDSSTHGPAYFQRINLNPCVDCSGHAYCR